MKWLDRMFRGLEGALFGRPSRPYRGITQYVVPPEYLPSPFCLPVGYPHRGSFLACDANHRNPDVDTLVEMNALYEDVNRRYPKIVDRLANHVIGPVQYGALGSWTYSPDADHIHRFVRPGGYWTEKPVDPYVWIDAPRLVDDRTGVSRG